MKCFWNSRRAHLLLVLSALAVTMVTAGCATAPAPSRIDASELLAAGFKVFVATTDVQKQWVRDRTPGQISEFQRTGKKYFIYPDAANNQAYVGGPDQFETYLERHPDTQLANQGSGMHSYVKQSDAMRKATARDLSDPYLGMSWNDFLW